MAEPTPNAAAQFAEDFVVEAPHIALAREASEEYGVLPVSPATGAALALAASGGAVSSIIEIGTGVGVSGLWLLEGAPEAVLTTIDVELEQHRLARKVFAAAGYPARQTRFITGRAAELLPRMNEGSYDLVLVDADAEPVLAYVEAALTLARPGGGAVLVARALQGGKVAQPSRRDRATLAHREMLRAVHDRTDVIAGISTVGEGLMHIVRR